MRTASGRVDLSDATPDAYQAMRALDREARRVGLDPRLVELIKLRASYVNGCTYCIQLHASRARAAGEREERLYALAAWRESPYFDEREQAALALCDALTRLGPESSVTTPYEEARNVFEDSELAAIVWTTVAINAWNRIAIATELAPPELADSHTRQTVSSSEVGVVAGDRDAG
jgi:AhpD family alkylhydroperoxidase